MIEALRQVLAVFRVDDTELKNGLKESNKLVDGLTDGLKHIAGPLMAAFSGAAVVGFAHDLLEASDAAAKTARSLGLGIDELQQWQHAAQLSGVAAEQVTVSITKLGQKIAQAKSGNAEMAKTFKSLGIDLDELSAIADRSLGDAFEHVGLALAGLEDKAQRTDTAMKLFEESGPKLFNLFKDGADSVKAMRNEVSELGFAFDEDFATGAEAFNDNIARLKKGGQGLLLQFLQPMLPVLLELSNELVKVAKQVIPVVREFVTWVRHTKLLDAALLVLSGKALKVGLGLITKWIAGVGGLTGALRGLMRLAFRVVAPFLILEDVLTFLAGGKSLLGRKLDDWLGDGTSDKVRDFIAEIGRFIKLFKTAPNEVRQAFASLPGDMQSQFGGFGEFIGTLGKFIVDTFLFTIDVLTGGWENFGNKFQAVGDWMLAALNIVWTELKFAGLGVAASIQDAFANTWNSIVEGAQRAIKAVADAAAKLPLTGGFLSKNLDEAASALTGLKGEDGHAQADVQKQLSEARMAIVADIESAQARMIKPATVQPSQSTLNDKERFNILLKEADAKYRETVVNVTIPPGASAKDIAMIKDGAREAAMQGVRAAIREDRLGTKAALVPRPAG